MSFLSPDIILFLFFTAAGIMAERLIVPSSPKTPLLEFLPFELDKTEIVTQLYHDQQKKLDFPVY